MENGQWKMDNGESADSDTVTERERERERM